MSLLRLLPLLLLLLCPPPVKSNHATYSKVPFLQSEFAVQVQKVPLRFGSYTTTYNTSYFSKMYDKLKDAASSAECTVSFSASECNKKFLSAYTANTGNLPSFQDMALSLSSIQSNPVGSFYSADTICSMHLEDGVNAGWKTLDDGSDKSYINVCTFITSNLYWPPSRVPLPKNVDPSVAFGITTTLNETVIQMAEKIGTAADAVAGQNAFQLATSKVIQIAQLYAAALQSLAAATCSNAPKLSDLPGAFIASNGKQDLSFWFLDASAALTHGKDNTKYPSGFGNFTDTFSRISPSGYADDAHSNFTETNGVPSDALMSVLVSMKSALMSRTCSFNTPVNDGLPGSVKSEASILASGADESLRLFSIANVRFMLKGVYAAWPNSNKNIFLKNVMSFLSLSSMATTPYITSALQKLTHTGLGVDVTQNSITNSLSEILVYLNIQRCKDEIGTLLTLSAGSKDCISYGYTATFGGDNKQVFAPWWKNMTGVTGGKYTTQTNVLAHSAIMIDTYNIYSNLKARNFYAGRNTQLYGGYSQNPPKNDKPVYRTMTGFSVKNKKCTQNNWSCGSLALYYEQSTPTRTDFPDTSSTPTWFGGMISLNAYPTYPPPPSYVRQTTAFADLDGKARYEAGTKYASFLTTMVYIQSEANDQYTDCLVDQSYSKNNIDSVTALDEAGAFFMGIYSQEKYGKGQTYNSITGLTQIYGGSWCDLQYKYVDGGPTPRFPAGIKFCTKLLDHLQGMQGKYLKLDSGAITCVALTPDLKDAWINDLNQMTNILQTPFFMGATYYVSKLDGDINIGSGSKWKEHLIEASAFQSAIFGSIAQCNFFNALNINNALEITTDFDTFKANYLTAGGADGILGNMVDSMPCLGLTCKDIGDSSDKFAKRVYDKCEASLQSKFPNEVTRNDPVYAAQQYNTFTTGVTGTGTILERCKISLDNAEINLLLIQGNFAGAQKVYKEGKYSSKAPKVMDGVTTISKRNLKQLGAKDPNTVALTFFQPVTTWGKEWSNVYIEALMKDCDDDFPKNTGPQQIECADAVSNAISQLNTNYYASWELSDCDSDCARDDINGNYGRVKACDEAYCFFSGIYQKMYSQTRWNTTAVNPTSTAPFSGYALSESLVSELFTGFPIALYSKANGVYESLPALYSSDAVFNFGQTKQNSQMTIRALDAQAASKAQQCLGNSDATEYNKPKKLNIAVKGMTAQLAVSAVMRFLSSTAAALSALEANVAPPKYQMKEIQSAFLPLQARLAYCDPYTYSKLQGWFLSETSPGKVVPTLTIDGLLGGKEVVGLAQQKANFDTTVKLVTRNYQCFGLSVCQELGELQIPKKNLATNLNAQSGKLAYDKVVEYCRSLPSPSSATNDPKQPGLTEANKAVIRLKQASFFNGTALSGSFEPPAQMAFTAYQFTTNCYQHILMDKDVLFINKLMKTKSNTELKVGNDGGFLSAQQVYRRGWNSFKSNCLQPQQSILDTTDSAALVAGQKCNFTKSGSYYNLKPNDGVGTQMRTLKRFNPIYKVDDSFKFKVNINNEAFWATKLGPILSKEWANELLNGVWGGTDSGNGAFPFESTKVSVGSRAEITKKVNANALFSLYSLREIQQAYTDACGTIGTANWYKANLHVDEGASFFTGSLMRDADITTKMNFGVSTFGLMMKRASQFTGVTAPGWTSLASQLNLYQDYVFIADQTKSCEKMKALNAELATSYLLPNVQSVVKYIYQNSNQKNSPWGKAIPQNFDQPEEIGELYAFATVVVPQVFAYDPDAGNFLYECVNMFPKSGDDTAPQSIYGAGHDWKECIGAIECAYTSMGITKGMFGNLIPKQVTGEDGESWEFGELCASYKAKSGQSSSSSTVQGSILVAVLAGWVALYALL